MFLVVRTFQSPVIYNRKNPDVPASATYVGRPTIWGNPFKVEDTGRDDAIERFEKWLPEHDTGLYRLRGKDLVCWCAPERCHAEVLEREANRGTLIAVTGHRPNKIGGYDPKAPLRLQIRSWLAQKGSGFESPMWITGGALGVDQDAAREAHKNGWPFMVAAPCLGQESKWPKSSQEDYRKMLTFADARLARRLHSEGGEHLDGGTIVVHNDTYPGPWVLQKRNEWMVDRCDILLGVWDGSDGGTSNCIAYATKIGKPVVWVDPTTLA